MHRGNLLSTTMKEKNVKISEISRMYGVLPNAIYKFMDDETLPIPILLKLGETFNYDFSVDLGVDSKEIRDLETPHQFLHRYLLENPITEINKKGYYVVMFNFFAADPRLMGMLADVKFDLFKELIFDEKEKIHLLLNPDKSPLCEICGKKTEFTTIAGGFNRFCSQKCRNNNPELLKKWSDRQTKLQARRTREEKDEMQRKLEETNMKNLGVRRPAQSKTIQEKIEETNQKKYNKKTYLLTSEADEARRAACMKEYGVDHISKTPEFRVHTNDAINKHALDSTREAYPSLNIMSYENALLKIKCDKCHKEYEIPRYLLRERMVIFKTNPCLHCNVIYSNLGMENEFIGYVTSLINEPFERGKRTLLGGKQLDLYLPDRKLAFEFNGLYWHSVKDDNPRITITYHKEKKDACKNLGIDLVHIYEDDWVYKRPIVESIIKNKLGMSEKVFARKCSVKAISNTIANEFLEINHIQGTANGSFCYGLFINEELLSVMTFSNHRVIFKDKKIKDPNRYELVRFCNRLGLSVVGGASKLFAAFIKERDPESVMSYASYDRSLGGMYEKLGFTYVKNTEPGYWYVIGNRRRNRFNYRKDMLIKMGYDESKTEAEIMAELKHHRLYDSGNMLFEWNKILSL